MTVRRRANGEGSVYQRKDGRWEAAAWVQTISGKRKRIRVYARARLEARAKLVTLLEQANQGRRHPDDPWKLEAYLAYWLEEIVKINRRERTWELYESVVRIHIDPYIGKKLLTKLSVQTVQIFLNDRIAHGASARTAQHIRTVLSSALSRAVKEEIVTRNVARLIEVPQWERKDVTPWTPSEARQFLAAAEPSSLYVAFLLLIHYGMRRGEVLGLRWCDIDFDNNLIYIRQQLQRFRSGIRTGPVKTSAGKRTLPLVPLARDRLLAHRRKTLGSDSQGTDASNIALVFRSSTGRPVEPHNLVRAFHRIRTRSGLPRITVHYLRHTTATLLKNLGTPARDAQLILGHAHISTTQQLYQHGNVEGQRAALEQMADSLQEVAA